MSLTFYDNYVDNVAQDSTQYWREKQQQSISKAYDNTSVKLTVQEENIPFDFIFEDVECWVNTVTDAIVSTEKDANDYRSLYFENIDHMVSRGRYYKFEDNYWITYESSDYIKTMSDIKVRRCNNWLKWINDDGELKEYPCVLEYNLMSPSPQVSKAITTSNGHVVIIVQGNADTLAIPRNTRFLFNGTPYKYVTINNYMQQDYVDEHTPILFLEAYWDVLQPNDNLEENIANDTRDSYNLTIDQTNLSQPQNTEGILTATIIKNGEIVERQVEWESSDENVITIDENGNYKIVGETNKTALITATMVGNKECTDTIVVNVVDIQESHKEIVVEPNFTRLSLFRSATFSAFVFDNDTQLSDVVTCVCSGADPTCYTFIDNGNNNWTLKNNKQSQIPLILTFTSGDLITELEVTLGAMY
jgi:hypothetical protein